MGSQTVRVAVNGYGVIGKRVADAVRAANGETGGAVVEMGEAEHMVRASGYLRTLEDFDAIPLGLGAGGIPVRLSDVAWVQIGPEMRRGIAELNGEGEVAGGVVVIRAGENAREVIEAVRTRLDELRRSLPEGVSLLRSQYSSMGTPSSTYSMTR